MVSLHADMKVRYKADPTTVGWVIGIVGETARVFMDGSPKLVPTVELEPALDLVEMTPDEFRVALTQRRLEHPLTDQLLSYRASKTRLYYHQFLPVKKILESPNQRLLIADEVGTGKTIEAGLIWAELESRAAHGLENVWIICPKSLVGKWREEMLQRFDFPLEPLSSQGLRQALVSLERDGVLPPRFAKSIVNLELIRAEEHLARLGETSIAWDLVIFDEAHHLRNPDTRSHALANLVCERSEAAIFLTATPLQTSLDDVVHLMIALGVDVAENPHLLGEQMRWDMELNDWIRLVRRRPPAWQQEHNRILSHLEAAGGTRRPGWSQFRQLVAESNMEDRQHRTIAVEAARDLQVLSPYMTRTLRSDVDESRPVREAITRVVEFSPEEEALYNEVYRVCLERAMQTDAPPGFITQMPERRTSSCVPAVASEILRYTDESEEEDHEARFTRRELRTLTPLAQAALRSQDQKLEALNQILDHTFGDLNADRVMIFSTFRGTLRYLEDKLRKKGYSVGLMYGPTPARDEDCRQGEKSRERIAAEFRKGEFQILLASEVAGEGLDFEHCHVLINYDLPWNPMRVEQRIGRCDRIGQLSDKVHVGSLASIGTIEERILSRLYERLHIFERALGDMEVILGEEIASFERDIFTSDLTRVQQSERLEAISQAVENRRLQQESIAESGVISLQGQQLLDSDQQEIKESESRFLSPDDLAEFVYASIDNHFPRSIRRTSSATEFDIHATNAFKDELNALLRSYPATNNARTQILRFRNRIDTGRTKVSFSDSGDDAEFAHIRHPLVLLARRLTREPLSDIPLCTGEISTTTLDRPTMLVWAVGSLEGYTNRVELLCTMIDCETGTVESISIEQAQKRMRQLSPLRQLHKVADTDAHQLLPQAEQALLAQFKDLTKTFNMRNSILSDKAKQAVTSHTKGRLDWLERQLARNDIKNNIRNLYRGWRRRLEAETQSKMEDIQLKSQVRSSLEVIGAVVMYPITSD